MKGGKCSLIMATSIWPSERSTIISNRNYWQLLILHVAYTFSNFFYTIIYINDIKNKEGFLCWSSKDLIIITTCINSKQVTIKIKNLYSLSFDIKSIRILRVWMKSVEVNFTSLMRFACLLCRLRGSYFPIWRLLSISQMLLHTP